MLTLKDTLLAIRRVADREKDYNIVTWCNVALSDASAINAPLYAIALLTPEHIITNDPQIAEALESQGRAEMIASKEINDVHG